MPAISSPAQNSSFHQTWGGYVETILPLVAAFLVVPVEDTRELPEWLREIYSWGLVTSKFAHEHLVFSRAAWNEGKWWTILTYCFSHQDVSHLLNNLFSLTFAGMNVYNHTSTALEFYAIFFSSAGLSAYLTTRKNELQLMPMAKSFVPRNPFPSSWIRLHGWYNSQANKIAESTGHFFSQFVQYRGASAGIFGMVGALAMIEVEEAWMWMRDVWSCIRNSGSVATSTRKRLALRCFALCYNALSIRGAVQNEFMLRSTNDGIGHNFHLDGFISGSCIIVAIKCVRGLGAYIGRRQIQKRVGRSRKGRS